MKRTNKKIRIIVAILMATALTLSGMLVFADGSAVESPVGDIGLSNGGAVVPNPADVGKSFVVTLGASGTALEDQYLNVTANGEAVTSGDSFLEGTDLNIKVSRGENDPYLILGINGETTDVSIMEYSLVHKLTKDTTISLELDIGLFAMNTHTVNYTNAACTANHGSPGVAHSFVATNNKAETLTYGTGQDAKDHYVINIAYSTCAGFWGTDSGTNTVGTVTVALPSSVQGKITAGTNSGQLLLNASGTTVGTGGNLATGKEETMIGALTLTGTGKIEANEPAGIPTSVKLTGVTGVTLNNVVLTTGYDLGAAKLTLSGTVDGGGVTNVVQTSGVIAINAITLDKITIRNNHATNQSQISNSTLGSETRLEGSHKIVLGTRVKHGAYLGNIEIASGLTPANGTTASPITTPILVKAGSITVIHGGTVTNNVGAANHIGNNVTFTVEGSGSFLMTGGLIGLSTGQPTNVEVAGSLTVSGGMLTEKSAIDGGTDIEISGTAMNPSIDGEMKTDTGNITMRGGNVSSTGKVETTSGNIALLGTTADIVMAGTMTTGSGGMVTIFEGSIEGGKFIGTEAIIKVGGGTSVIGRPALLRGETVTISSTNTYGADRVSVSDGGTLTLIDGATYDEVFLGGMTDGNRTIPANATVSNLYWGSDYTSTATGKLILGATEGKITHVFLGGDGQPVASPTLEIADERTATNGYAITDVYLGGINSSNVTGTATYVLDGEELSGSIYGGGLDANNGTVDKAVIKVTGGKASTVYGAGSQGGTVIVAEIDVTGGSLTSIYGGGKNGGNIGTSSTINVSANVLAGASSGMDTGIIHGGAFGGGTVKLVTINLEGGFDYTPHSIFGGGYSGGTVTSAIINVSGSGTKVANVYGGAENGGTVTDVVTTIGASTTATNVFGGGLGGGTGNNTVKSETIVNGTVSGQLYGGGHDANIGIGGTTLNINSGSTITGVTVYGGGLAVASQTANVAGKATVNLLKTANKNIYGGGHANGGTATTGSTEVNLSAAVGVEADKLSVYGGGHGISGDASVGGTATLNINDGATLFAPAYGGGHGAGGTADAKGTVLNLNSAQKIDIYGGGHSATSATSIGVDGTAVNINAKLDGSSYGGGHAVGAKATADSTGTTITGSNVTGNVFGGGHGAYDSEVADVTNGTNIKLTGASTVDLSLFGGGFAENASSKATTGNTVIDLAGTSATAQSVVAGNIYGGGWAKAADSEGSSKTTSVTMTKFAKTTNVYGGGYASANNSVASATDTTISLKTAGSVISANVYGGGFASVADGETASSNITSSDVSLTGGPAVSVYGGGHAKGGTDTEANVSELTKISVTGSTLTGNIFGGGFAETASTTATVGGTVEINTTGATLQNLYGGGNANGDSTKVSVVGKVSITSGTTTVNGDFFGGGLANGASAIADVGSTVTMVLTDVDVTGGLYGGGHGAGGYSTANVSGGITHDLTEVTVGEDFVAGGVARGIGASANVGGAVSTTHTGGAVGGSYFGGGVAEGVMTNAKVESTVTMVLTDVDVTGGLYGGGHGAGGYSTANVGGAISITHTGGSAGSYTGGGIAEGVSSSAMVTGDITIDTIDVDINTFFVGGGIADANTTNASVSGVISVTQTSTATSTIGGDYIGGGHATAADANANVGGVTLDLSNVDIEGKFTGGGCAEYSPSSATVDGNIDITLDTVNITESYTGGGYAELASSVADVSGGITHNLNSVYIGKIFVGGGWASTGDSSATTGGSISITYSGGDVGGIKDSLIGGGFAAGDDSDASVTGGVSMTLTSVDVANDVIGGGVAGANPSTAKVDGDIEITLDTVNIYGVYIGGGDAKSDNSVADVSGSITHDLANVTIDSVFVGGGYAYYATATAKTGGSISIIYNGGKVGGVKEAFVGGGLAGGDDSDASVTGGVTITLTNVNVNDVIGGGFAGGISSKADVGGDVTITHTGGTVDGNYFGGGNAHEDDASANAENISVTLSGVDVTGNIYGGGSVDGIGAFADVKNVTLSLTDSKAEDVYGGGDNEFLADTASAVVDGKVAIEVNETTAGATILTNIYGGGYYDNVNEHVTIVMNGGEVGDDIHGGGYNGVVEGSKAVAVADSGKTYNVSAHVQVLGGTVLNNIYGGGEGAAGEMKAGTVVEVRNPTIVSGNVYGGGEDRPTATDGAKTPSTAVIVGGEIVGNIYGGGSDDVAAGTSGNATVNNGDVDVYIVRNGAVYGTAANVYGGGVNGTAASPHKVAGNVSVVIQGEVLGDVSGGGINYGDVGGNTSVLIDSSGLVVADVRGGGIDYSPVEGNATLVVAGKVDGNAYGGGVNFSPVKGDVGTNTKVTGTVIQTVYGGGSNNSYTTGASKVILTSGGTIGGDVHGGGILNSPINGGLGTNTSIHGNVTNGTVYGGGIDQSPVTTGGSVVLVGTTGTVKVDVFGGGNTNSDVKLNSSVTILGNIGQNVYGGGTLTSNVGGNATVAVSGTSAKVGGSVYGGGFTTSNINGTVGTSVTVEGGAYVNKDVYGGGIDNAHVAGNAKVVVSGATTKVDRSVYGGGNGTSDIKGAVGTTVTINNATVLFDVFGGGIDNGNVVGNAIVTVNSGKIGRNVYGGGTTNGEGVVGTAGSVTGGYTDVAITDSDVSSVFGGGFENSPVNGKNGVLGSKVQLLGNSTASGDVYGGGIVNSPLTTGGTSVFIDKQAIVGQSVYGGGNTSSGVRLDTVVNIAGLVNGSVYGGGRTDSPVNGPIGTNVTIQTTGLVNKEVFGGGIAISDVTANTITIILGRVCENVYGGGSTTSNVFGIGGTTVVVKSGAVVGNNVKDFTKEYPAVGNVYGGGFNSSLVSNSGGKGTDVLIEANSQVTGTVYGGGNKGSHVLALSAGGVKVVVKGEVGMVHGGGLNSQTVNTKNGTYVHITEATGKVYHNVYGGGHGLAGVVDNSYNLKSDILIDKGSNVVEAVFGGGKGLGADTKGTTNILVKDKGTIIGDRPTLEGLYDSNGYPSNTKISGWMDNVDYGPDHYASFNTRDCGQFHLLGSIFGGGNDANVETETNIVINPTGQLAYNFISGGNIKHPTTKLSSTTEIPKNITINNLGQNRTGEIYSPLDEYAVIRVLQDYTKGEINNSFLTVYYHLDGYDNGTNILAEDYPTITGVMDFNGGVYHAWRPQPHTNIVVEPVLNLKDGAMFRVHFDYIVDFKAGIFATAPLEKDRFIQLLIDLRENPGSTTKIYAPPGVVIPKAPFRYDHLPIALKPTDMYDQGNRDVLGTNFYIPPQNVTGTPGTGTITGGSNTSDKGIGSGGRDQGTGGSGYYGGGNSAAKVGTGTVGGYYTSPTTVLNEKTAVSSAVAAVKAVGAGKTGIVTEKKAGQVKAATLIAMQKAAGGKVMYHADTVRGNAVEGRMYINPALVVTGKTPEVINTSIYTSTDAVASVKAIFTKYFTNTNLVVVRMAHSGDLGMEVEVAAKVDLKNFNIATLYFYVYNAQTNSYVKLVNPKSFVDTSGYLHFYTSVGGNIIVTDQPLARK